MAIYQPRSSRSANILLAATLILCGAGIAFYFIKQPYSAVDNGWCYVVMQNIKNGHMPYRDFSIVITPLYYLIYSLPLHIYDNYLTVKLTDVFTAFLYLAVWCRIMQKLHFKMQARPVVIILTSIVFFTCPEGTNYSTILELCLAICIYLLYDIFQASASKKHIILLSLLCCAMILTKHTVGTVVTVSVFLIMLILCIMKKMPYKYIPLFFLMCVSIGALFILWLWRGGALSEFFDCVLFGPQTFVRTSFTIHSVLSNLVRSEGYIVLFSGMILCAATAFIFRLPFARVSLIIQLFNFIMIYPIANTAHYNAMCPAAQMYIVLAIHELAVYLCLKEHRNPFKKIADLSPKLAEFFASAKDPKFLKTINISFPLLMYVISIAAYIYGCNERFGDVVILNEKYFNNISMTTGNYSKISDMIEYTKAHPDRKLFSPEDVYSGIESISGHEVDGMWNCMLMGNIGTDDITERIDAAAEIPNAYFYIYSNKGDVFWQSFEEADEYIKDNFEFVESVGRFKIYKPR